MASYNLTQSIQGRKHLSRLALGTVQFGLPYGIANLAGQVPHTEARSMLQLALANGIDILDTAIAYGEAEMSLGAIGTEGFKLVTKLPALPVHCVDVSIWVQQQVRASLSRLGVTAIYGLLMHKPEQLLGPNGALLYQAVKELKENGVVQKVGVSIYSPNILADLTHRYHFDLIQSPFNLVDRRLYSSGWLQRLKDDDVEIHTRSVFLQGLLLMAQVDMPAKFAPWSELWNIWHQWLADHDGSAVQASLAFPLSFPEIDQVVVGADSVCQLRQIVHAAKCQPKIVLPNLQCEDENLINPVNWPTL